MACGSLAQAQGVRDARHPLPHGQARQHLIDQQGRGLAHALGQNRVVRGFDLGSGNPFIGSG
jgi:hypothetical protein